MDAINGAVGTRVTQRFVYGACRRRTCVDPAGPNRFHLCPTCLREQRAKDRQKYHEIQASPTATAPLPPNALQAFVWKVIDYYRPRLVASMRDDFAQDIWVKLLNARVLERCVDFPEERQRSFISAAIWRHALNCKRTFRRKIEPAILVAPDDPVLIEITSGCDEELLAHHRHMLHKLPAHVEGVMGGLAPPGGVVALRKQFTPDTI